MEINYIRKYRQDSVEFVYLEYAGVIYCIDVINSGGKSESELIEAAKSELIKYLSTITNSQLTPEDKLSEEYIRNGVGSDALVEPLFSAFTEFCRQYELHYEELDKISAKRQEIRTNIG